MKLLTSVAAIAALLGTGALAQELNVPNFSYRTGPFASTGIPLMNGQRDYLLMLNERDGGIGGLEVNYSECETGYATEKGVECYESNKADALVTQPWSTGITLQVLPQTNVDEIPIFAPGYGFSPMRDGRVFQWAFNIPAGYWDGASMLIQALLDENDGSLEGKKIAFLHLDHPYGKEPLPFFEDAAERQGFELLPIPVGLTEMQNQSAQWLQIRRERPDYVIMWAWGAMNGSAIKEAVRTKYPMDQFLSVWWGSHTDDLQPVGEDGTGFRSISWSKPVDDAPAMQAIREHVIDAGESLADEEQASEVYYQRGVVMSAILAEAIRVAQDNAGTPEITPTDMRYGFENLKMDEARLEELGISGMVPPFETSCADHTGQGGGWMLEWNGSEFVQASDLLKPEMDKIAPLVEANAQEYADANAPWPVNEECNVGG
ncbi:amino acid/amide ABC transporter substrate-binding protein, HAAT family [Roseivivax marinus]|uniref:ABC transporter substrate-binding protein n=1 Tax=Roseivivax marinus TaxID=1379903 RepID=UPI0008D2C649|nr:ABC transporter substrate-binding protein [Roseivivax marinus]SEK27467.1 amino acid/amide ABC transporter substrate-binding protein, HAAT family [Roseivivax marinus]